jgi:hypothetical protein
MNKEKNNNLEKWYKISVLTLLAIILALSFITLYIVFIGYVFSFGAPECIEGQVEYCGTEIECNDVSCYWCQNRYVTDMKYIMLIYLVLNQLVVLKNISKDDNA